MHDHQPLMGKPIKKVKKKLKFLIYIVPFHRIFIVSKALYNNI